MVRWVVRAAAAGAAGLLVLLLLSLAGLIGYARVESGRQVTLPAPTGPDRVGRTLYDWTDPSRLDPYAPGRSTPRELPVLVWYPAASAAGAAATTYLPPGWDRALGGGGVDDLVHTAPTLIHPRAVEDAPVAAAGSPYPVLVFSPGLGLAASDYTAIAEDLASHGYVVAGVNPTDSTDVVLAGGRVVRSVARARDDADYGQLVQVWADDLRFVAGQLRALDAEPGGRFQGRLQTDRVGFFGHSAGGAAATLACRQDDRCPGAVDIDGDLAGDVLRTGLGKPFLFLADRDALTREPNLKAMLRGVLQGEPPDQGHVLTVAGTGHENFTDRGLYFNLFGSQLEFMGRIDGARALRITGACVRAFFDTYQLGRPSPLLGGASPAYPEVHPEAV